MVIFVTHLENIFVFSQCSSYLATDKEILTLYTLKHQGTVAVSPLNRLLSILLAQKSHLLLIKTHKPKYTTLEKVPIKVCMYL